MTNEVWLALITEHGPWAFLTVFLLWRDYQKDTATREVLNRNSEVLIEMATLVRERLPRGAG